MAIEKKRPREELENDIEKAKEYSRDVGSSLGTEKVLHLILEAIIDIREMLENLVDNGIKTKQ